MQFYIWVKSQVYVNNINKDSKSTRFSQMIYFKTFTLLQWTILILSKYYSTLNFVQICQFEFHCILLNLCIVSKNVYLCVDMQFNINNYQLGAESQSQSVGLFSIMHRFNLISIHFSEFISRIAAELNMYHDILCHGVHVLFNKLLMYQKKSFASN